MRRDRRVVNTQKRGPVAKARSVRGALSQIITAAMPTSVSAFANSGSSAVTATSCSNPTSLVTRTIKSPLRAPVWNESERRCRWLYSSLLTVVSTRLPTRAKPTVL